MSDALQRLRDPRPLAVQVYDQIYKAIHSDDSSLKGEIPTETSLTNLLGVSRTTVRTALALLEEDGLLARGPGRRRYVVHSPEQDAPRIPTLEQLFNISQRGKLEVVHRQEVPATRWGASKLQVPSNTPLTVWATRITDGDTIVCDSIELAPVDIASAAAATDSSLLHALGDEFSSSCVYESIQMGPYSNQTRDAIPVDNASPRIVLTLVISRDGRPTYLAKHVALLERMPISLLNPRR